MGSGIWCREIRKTKTSNSFGDLLSIPDLLLSIFYYILHCKVIQTCKTIIKSHKISISHFSWYLMVASVMCSKGCIWSIPWLSRYSPLKCQAPCLFSPLVAMDCSTVTTQFSPLLPHPSMSGLLWFLPFQPVLVPSWLSESSHKGTVEVNWLGFSD